MQKCNIHTHNDDTGKQHSAASRVKYSHHLLGFNDIRTGSNKCHRGR